jgi:CheY-like chemotaxis protein
MFAYRLPSCLVLDQSATVCKVIQIILYRAGSPACTTFSDPLLALQTMATKGMPLPDVALISYQLPLMDGIEVIRLMQHHHYPTATVLLLNQDENSALMRIKARLAGARATLAKPLTTQQLLALLSTFTTSS